MIHELKILPKYFDDIRYGKKRFELRRNDRDFLLCVPKLLQNIFRHGDRGLLLSLRAGIGLG